MKRIIYLFLASIIASALSGCTEKVEGPTGGKELDKNVKFSIEIVEEKENSVKIKVNSTGTDIETWYGFHIEGTIGEKDEKKLLSEIAKKLEEISKKEHITGLKSENQVFFVNGLADGVDYTYIVFGITADGMYYGTPVFANFSTLKKMAVNSNWTLSYEGPGEVLGVQEKYTAKCTVTNGDGTRYFITACDTLVYNLYEIREIAEDELALQLYEVALANEELGKEVSLYDILKSETSIDAPGIIPGSWRLLAFGVTEDDKLSGDYAVSEPFDIPKETPSEAYSSWLGTWTWTGANGKTETVKFHDENPNYYYLMTGWDKYGEAEEDPRIGVEYVEKDNAWKIFPEPLGMVSFTNGEEGVIWIAGTYETEGGGKNYNGLSYAICIGGINKDTGARECYGFDGEITDTQGNSKTVKVTMMEYVAQTSAGWQLITDPEIELPTFPVTITPHIESGENPDEGEAKSDGKIDAKLLSKQIKSIKAAKLSKYQAAKARKQIDAYYQGYCNSLK